MRAGRLRHRLLLQQPTTTTDATSGAAVESWSDVAEVWGAVEPVTSRERITADQVVAEITHRIFIRDRGDVAATWRVRFGDRVFHLSGSPIRRDERRIQLELLATEEPA